MNFGSDNVTGCAPEVLSALMAANTGPAIPYGNDPWTIETQARLRVLFDKPDLRAFPVISGTAGNALALSTLVPPHGAVLCHREAHIAVDECGAVETFSGGARLMLLDGPDGKVTPQAATAALARAGLRDVHRSQPRAMSITQATECGTLYQPDEIAALSALCRDNGLHLHLDGARFANAVAALGCSPADLTWKAGVDVMTFGATKNGCWAAEAVIFFNPALVADFEYRRKRTGHLLSKGRLLAAQLTAYVTDDLWLNNARHANTMAARLGQGLADLPGVDLIWPVESNEIFARLPAPVQDRLKAAGVIFVPWSDAGENVVRFVCSFASTAEDVDAVLRIAAA